MAVGVAEQARRNNVGLRVSAAVLARNKVLGGALERAGELTRNSMDLGEDGLIVKPHRQIAVEAPAVLTKKSGGAVAGESAHGDTCWYKQVPVRR